MKIIGKDGEVVKTLLIVDKPKAVQCESCGPKRSGKAVKRNGTCALSK